MLSRNAGFTLIELSIVLVIIGLIVGGVLVGQDLIRAAEVRAQITQFEKLNLATRAFQLKVNALPGDITLGQAQLFGLSYYDGGNGDQVLGDDLGNVPITRLWEEPYYFFINLSDLNMLEGNYRFVVGHYSRGEQYPQAKIGNGGIVAFTQADRRLAWYLGMGPGTTIASGAPDSAIALLSTSGVISARDAYGIDAKIDDGLPMSGGVRPATSTTIYDTTSNSCITGPVTNTYNVTNLQLNCRLIVRAQ